MRVLKIAFVLILLVAVASCRRMSSVEAEQSVSIIGKWAIVGALSRDSRSDVEPEAQTLQFSRDGVFKSWCRISEKDQESTGEYVTELTKGNSVDIAIQMRTGRIHPNSFKLTDARRGDVEGYDDQGNMRLYKDILTFTDHNGRKRAYERE